jgi:tetratricopeptide (TPR) repeat protein
MENDSTALTNATLKLKQAVEYESMGKYESALMALDEALAIQPDNSDAWLIKGVLLGKQGRCSEAQKCYDKILEYNPQSADAWRLKAATYSSLDQHEKAIECFLYAIKIKPDSLEFRLALAATLQKLKRYEEAEACFAQTKQYWPNDARVDYYTGVMWGNRADYQKGLAHFEAALQLKPDFLDALLAKGIMLGKLGRKEEAQTVANQILEIKGANTKDKPQTAYVQSENEAIRSDFKVAQEKFKNRFAQS